MTVGVWPIDGCSARVHDRPGQSILPFVSHRIGLDGHARQAPHPTPVWDLLQAMPTSPSPTPAPPRIVDVEVIGRTGEGAFLAEELVELRRARALLTGPGVAVRFANLIGSPIEKGLRMLPEGATRLVHHATRTALEQALRLAVHSIDSDSQANRNPRNRLHKVLVGASGAVGGAFGLGALFLELPLSTTLMLRSIARVAASQGHDLNQLSVRLACLEVFALGGDTRTDDAAETSYWAIRAALAQLVSEAVTSIAARGVVTGPTPAAIRLLTALAARFGVLVTEEIAAKAIPVVGAATGAAINVVFLDHFQKMAEGHFILRRLEARHGTETVRRAYESLAARYSP